MAPLCRWRSRPQLVPAWREAGALFDSRERAALAWAETVTRVADTAIPDGEFPLCLNEDKRLAIRFFKDVVGKTGVNIFFHGHSISRPSEKLMQNEINDLMAGLRFVAVTVRRVRDYRWQPGKRVIFQCRFWHFLGPQA
jgi:hypothetical protein